MIQQWAEALGGFGSSTGAILLFLMVAWTAAAYIIYWALKSGTATHGEEIKHKYVEDDLPMVGGDAE